MKPIFPILLCLTVLCPAFGQETDDEAALALKVQNAIREFNGQNDADKDAVNEVVVVVPPLEAKSEQADEVPAVAIPVTEPVADDDIPAGAKPTLVTGKPPAEDSEEDLAEESGDQPEETGVEVSEADTEAPVETAPAEQEGLGIRIEPIRDGKGGAVPGQIKLKASFPAKALSTTPDGWVLEKSEQAPAFIEKVTLRPGKTISLSISPHLLAPAADGENTFGVVEPGFDASEGYRQSNTVSAILGKSVVQLDRDALLLGNAISDLHQLLSSLPKPEPQPEDIAKPKKP